MITFPSDRHRRYIGFNLFWFGLYAQVRWEGRWYHGKVGIWRQANMRLDTRTQRRMKKDGRNSLPRRYTTHVYRCQVSLWRSRVGHQGTSRQAGVMLYAGRQGELTRARPRI